MLFIIQMISDNKMTDDKIKFEVQEFFIMLSYASNILNNFGWPFPSNLHQQNFETGK